MVVLYDEEEVMRSYVESEVNDAILDAKVKIATDMIRGNEPLEKVVKYSGLQEEKVLELYGGGLFFVAAGQRGEGQVFGIGCKIFTIAGPVILYGIFASWLLGVAYWVGKMVGIV